MPGLRNLQARQHFGLAQVTSSGCQPVMLKSRETDEECLERNHTALRHLSTAVPDIVLLNALWRTDAVELKPSIDALRAIGVRRIIILGTVPIWRGGLPSLVDAYYRRERELLPEFTPLMVDGRSEKDGMYLAAAQLAVEYISLRARCAAVTSVEHESVTN